METSFLNLAFIFKSNSTDVNTGTMSQMTAASANIPLSFLLIGKTGHGKSATGNSILGRKEFKSSAGMRSETKEMRACYTEHSQYEIKVVDGPGLEDTNLTKAEDMQQAFNNMDSALYLCNGGVHVFLLVVRFGTRFTRDERRLLLDLKSCFGKNYLKDHGIIIVTGGDQFLSVMDQDDTPDKSFKEWCQEQDEDLFKECSDRIVLFNNVTKNEEVISSQRNELFQHAEKLSKKKGLYTNELFKMYADIREEMTKRNDEYFYKENVHRQISFLITELGYIAENPTLKELDFLEKRKEDLCKEIVDDKSIHNLHDDLREIQNSTDELRRAVNDKNAADARIQFHVQSLQKKRENLERTRESLWKATNEGFKKALTNMFSGAACSTNDMRKALMSKGHGILTEMRKKMGSERKNKGPEKNEEQ